MKRTNLGIMINLCWKWRNDWGIKDRKRPLKFDKTTFEYFCQSDLCWIRTNNRHKELSSREPNRPEGKVKYHCEQHQTAWASSDTQMLLAHGAIRVPGLHSDAYSWQSSSVLASGPLNKTVHFMHASCLPWVISPNDCHSSSSHLRQMVLLGWLAGPQWSHSTQASDLAHCGMPWAESGMGSCFCSWLQR